MQRLYLVSRRLSFAVLTAIILFAFLPWTLAYGGEPSSAQTAVPGKQAPVKSVQPSDSPEQPNNPMAPETKQAENSLEFMMGSSPIRPVQVIPSNASEDPAAATALSTPATTATALPVQPPVSGTAVPVGTGKVTGQLRSVMQDSSDSVAMLVSETCDQGGSAADGTSSCKRTYSNGNHATVITQRASAGDEFKLQSVITEYDKDNDLLYTKTIRQRIDYNYLQRDDGTQEDRGKERELFDIVLEPAKGKTTRELMIFQYDLQSGKVKAMTWTQYEQLGNQPKAGLVYHASLHYDQNGDPLRGVAERWDHGRKVASYLDWSALRQGRLGFDQEAWHEWESWIKSVSVQTYLP